MALSTTVACALPYTEHESELSHVYKSFQSTYTQQSRPLNTRARHHGSPSDVAIS
jgi:hypothetical protein